MEEKVFIKNPSGLKLAAIINRPEKTGRIPVVILLFGLLGYKEHIRGELLQKLLTKKGIGVVRFDASGFGESEGTIEQDYRFTNYVGDAQAVFDFIVNLPWVDKERVGVFGESMGGIQAIILTKNNQASIKGLALVSSPIVMGSDDDLKGKYKTWEREGYLERVSSKYGVLQIPYAFILDARKWNALDYLHDMEVPKLVIWGTNDINVPPQITKQIFDSAKDPKEFKVFEGADHFLNRDPKIIESMAENVALFFLRELKK